MKRLNETDIQTETASQIEDGAKIRKNTEYSKEDTKKASINGITGHFSTNDSYESRRQRAAHSPNNTLRVAVDGAKLQKNLNFPSKHLIFSKKNGSFAVAISIAKTKLTSWHPRRDFLFYIWPL